MIKTPHQQPPPFDPYAGLTVDQRIEAFRAEVEHVRVSQELQRLELDKLRVAIEEKRTFIESINVYALAAIRSLMLVGGAGAIAILAFLGHLATNPVESRLNDITTLVPSLMAFGVTALMAAIAAAFAYLCQVFFATESEENRELHIGLGHVFRVVAIVLVFGGYGLFLWGLFDAAEAFKTLRTVAGT